MSHGHLERTGKWCKRCSCDVAWLRNFASALGSSNFAVCFELKVLFHALLSILQHFATNVLCIVLARNCLCNQLSSPTIKLYGSNIFNLMQSKGFPSNELWKSSLTNMYPTCLNLKMICRTLPELPSYSNKSSQQCRYNLHFGILLLQFLYTILSHMFVHVIVGLFLLHVC